MRKIWKTKLFLKYFLSYLVIFLVPFLVMGSSLYKQSVIELKSTIENSNVDKLKQLQMFVDSRVEELREISTQIAYDQRLTPYMVNHSYYGLEAREELEKYRVNSSMIKEIFLYYPNQNKIFSSKGMNSLDVFFQRSYLFSSWNANIFESQMKALNKPTVLSDAAREVYQPNNSMMAFLYPIPPNTPSKHGVVMYFVNQHHITQSMDDVLGELEGTVIITDGDGNVLSEVNRGMENGYLDTVLQPMLATNTGVVTTQLFDESYSVMKVKTPGTEWSYMTAIPEKSFFSGLDTLKWSLLLQGLGLVLVGMLASFLLSLRNYKPVGHLTNLVQQKLVRPMRHSHKNELSRLAEMIEWVFDEKDMLTKQYDKQEPFVLQQCFLELLKGDHADKEQTLEILKQHGIELDGEGFFVMIVSAHDKEIDPLLRGPLKHIQLEKAFAYAVELVHDQCVAYMVQLHKQDKGLQQEVVSNIQQALMDGWTEAPVIGIGNTHAAVEDFNSSFIEAMSALDYGQVTGEQIVFFKEMGRNSKLDLWYSKEYHVKLSQSIAAGESQVASKVLTEMFTHLRTSQLDPALIKCMYYDVINLVLRTAHEQGIAMQTSVNELTSLQNIDELESALQEYTVQLCQIVRSTLHEKKEEDLKRVMDFIDANYCDHSLSLDKVGSVFQLTETNISRLIKEWTGTTFTTYIWELRLEKAKELLISTDLSVKDIVKEVGYVDVANFSRKFKKTTDLTPGQFRRQMQLSKTTTHP
ncbi:AraC family transcriptional regulator [Bacillaceae bacterium SIJ1]|uniref:helix-turn-helix domain-containing protein n=1 Tax=Litoribacterium kuwaitense TaxID=1398745 RepID=UPI0013E9A454|nr:helix-turn-helix domain-containing protein [Litoribacterium kuwaitense]NGP43916.1 AraC family transcriptional regulator [Litoribacterium kuwaitense]